MVIIVVTLHEVRINVYFILISESRPYALSYRQGRINHWASRTNARGLALLRASRLDIKTLLYWF